MARSVAKDPNYPLKHAQITDLKDTKRMAEEVKDADIVVIRNGETIGYFVSPEHFEALIEASSDSDKRMSERFYINYAKRHGSLDRLAESDAAARRGEFVSADALERVFDAE